MRVVESINSALRSYLGSDKNALFIGEDILDPYGGAFRVALGLSSRYPDQVITTPISESGIVGIAVGFAIKGRPVCVEIMFGDFITLATDQIVNHMAKLSWVYADQISVPVVVRTPMGGRRGYGSTHSQSLEKHFCGVPGLTVKAISEYADISKIYNDAFSAGTPHLIIENKSLYPRELQKNPFENVANPDIVIVSYGGCMSDCVLAATDLRDEQEIDAKVVEVSSLWPFDREIILKAVGNCEAVLTVEEGSVGWGFASEVAHSLISNKLNVAFGSISAPDHPIPSSRSMEIKVLPNKDTVLQNALNIVKNKE